MKFDSVKKSQPTLHVHIDRPLTQLSIAYIQDEKEFIADKAVPSIIVENQSNLFYKFNKDDFFRSEAMKRAPGTVSAGGGFNLTTDSYVCDIYAYHQTIPDAVRKNADIDLDIAAVQFTTRKILLKKEEVVNNVLFGTNWGTKLAGASSAGSGKVIYWNETGSNPVDDITNIRMSIKKNTGISPNTIVLGEQVYEVIRRHQVIRDFYKYTTNQIVTEDMIAKVLGVDRVLVSRAVINKAQEGAAAQYDWIAGNSVFCGYMAPSASIMTPSAAYTFIWDYAGTGGIVVKNIRDERIESDIIEAQTAFACKAVCTDLGAVIENVLK